MRYLANYDHLKNVPSFITAAHDYAEMVRYEPQDPVEYFYEVVCSEDWSDGEILLEISRWETADGVTTDFACGDNTWLAYSSEEWEV